jgi:hypothetical protein
VEVPVVGLAAAKWPSEGLLPMDSSAIDQGSGRVKDNASTIVPKNSSIDPRVNIL